MGRGGGLVVFLCVYVFFLRRGRVLGYWGIVGVLLGFICVFIEFLVDIGVFRVMEGFFLGLFWFLSSYCV